MIKLYVDGKLLSQLDISGGGLFDNPHYLLLNLAMGGTLGGNIPNSFVQDTLVVDYVRYYRKVTRLKKLKEKTILKPLTFFRRPL